MLLIWLIFWYKIFFVLLPVIAQTNNTKEKAKWDFFQNDYDIDLHIVEVSFYNHSYYRYFRANMDLYNRTQRVFNCSAYLIKYHSIDIKLDVQAYIFRSNEYRFFPITVTINPCVEYKQNSFRAKELMKKLSNGNFCPGRKGLLYVRNALPDYSKFPPYIPRGQYKLTTKWYHKSDFIIELDFYASVEDKPMKWW